MAIGALAVLVLCAVEQVECQHAATTAHSLACFLPRNLSSIPLAPAACRGLPFPRPLLSPLYYSDTRDTVLFAARRTFPFPSLFSPHLSLVTFELLDSTLDYSVQLPTTTTCPFRPRGPPFSLLSLSLAPPPLSSCLNPRLIVNARPGSVHHSPLASPFLDAPSLRTRMTSVYSTSSTTSYSGLPSSGPSRNSSRNGHHPRPPLDRMPSTYSDTPVATNSVVNKVASASSSLYQNCRTVLERLYRVPGFADQFIDSDNNNNNGPGEQLNGGAGEGDDLHGGLSNDPVSRSLHTLRLGSSLCYLFNALGLPHQLEVNPAATMSNLKACQRGTAHFVMACKRDLQWPDQELFAIHELYGQDTNGVVKVSSPLSSPSPSFQPFSSLLLGSRVRFANAVVALSRKRASV